MNHSTLIRHVWTLAVCFVVNGCYGSDLPDPGENPNSPRQDAVRFLALGDSYTIGEGVRASGRWPRLLVDRLRHEGRIVASPEIVAQTGWTTGDLSKGMDQAGLAKDYDLVGLLIGVNNQFRGESLEKYRTEFGSLIQRAIQLAGDNPSRVIVLSIPDWGVTPFAASRNPLKIAAEIDRFNAVNREESSQAGVYYVDVTTISREAADDKTLLAGDGLHPSAKMYDRWAQVLLPLVRKIL